MFVNPRRIESAEAGEHVFIRPDTDVYFLAAFLNGLIREGELDQQHIAKYMRGFDTLAQTVSSWTAERQAQATGIPVETFNDLLQAHIRAGGAALYMSTGVNQGRSGSLCYWLLQAINLVSGRVLECAYSTDIHKDGRANNTATATVTHCGPRDFL